MKKLIIPIVILFAVFASLIVNESILSNDNSASMALPYFNVRVMQVGGTVPQKDAEVVYKIGSTEITTGTTDINGWCYKNLGTGTYDVYVY